MSPSARKTLRTTLEDIDSYIDTGIGLAIERGGNVATRRRATRLVLQISSLLHASRHITRFEGSFRRLDDLLRWTFEVIHRAYGSRTPIAEWPPVPSEPAAGALPRQRERVGRAAQ